MRTSDITVIKYERGTNETIDRFLEDEDTLWILNGPVGRLPILAASEEEAVTEYKAKKAKPYGTQQGEKLP